MEAGLRLWECLQHEQGPARTATGGGLSSSVSALSLTVGGADGAEISTRASSPHNPKEVQQSVSLLCERVCEAALQRAQADAATKEELVAAGVRGALSAVLALRVGLTR